jgi:hypothetical protein
MTIPVTAGEPVFEHRRAGEKKAINFKLLGVTLWDFLMWQGNCSNSA